jgi:isopentenyl diphosphate isomerase/L-lactate dehydrogenase-like FMN-dependent dehydrogenase
MATTRREARASGRPPSYQLYVTRDRGATRDEAQRAENAGSKVLFVTVDGAAAGVRNSMMRPPFRPVATPGDLRTDADSSLTWKDRMAAIDCPDSDSGEGASSIRVVQKAPSRKESRG